MTRVRWQRAGWLLAALLALPACLMVHDREGVPVTQAMVQNIVVGETTRDEVLALAGAPTGTYSTDLLAALTRVGEAFTPPAATQPLHPDIYVWQQIDSSVQIAFFPVLFVWSSASISSRTLMVMFDESGRVSEKAFREDRP